MAFPNKKPGGIMIAIKPGGGPPPLRGPDAPPQAPEPDADEQRGGAPDQDQDDQGNWDEWLEFHDGATDHCEVCTYMQSDGFCPQVKHNVPPTGWCKAFTDNGSQTQQAEQPLAPEGQGQPPQ